MRTVADKTPTTPDETLRIELRDVVDETIEIHPGPDMQTMTEDVVEAVIARLQLRASGIFIDDNDETRPVERFRAITGKMDVVGHG
jgi:hypothetical protein